MNERINGSFRIIFVEAGRRFMLAVRFVMKMKLLVSDVTERRKENYFLINDRLLSDLVWGNFSFYLDYLSYAICINFNLVAASEAQFPFPKKSQFHIATLHNENFFDLCADSSLC